jgi:hypothetical protein
MKTQLSSAHVPKTLLKQAKSMANALKSLPEGTVSKKKVPTFIRDNDQSLFFASFDVGKTRFSVSASGKQVQLMDQDSELIAVGKLPKRFGTEAADASSIEWK